MTRAVRKRAIAVVVLLLAGCGAAPAPKPHPAPANLKLTIWSDQPAYDLDTARDGNLIVRARFKNTSSQTILLAHPNVGFPHRIKEGETLLREDERGALSVAIERPQGADVDLTNHILRLFEPGGRDHLLIPPGGTEEILLGWFGPHFSLGQWAGLEEPIFTAPGEYRLTVRYWNEWPVAYLTDDAGTPSAVTPWIGTVESNTITLTVR